MQDILHSHRLEKILKNVTFHEIFVRALRLNSTRRSAKKRDLIDEVRERPVLWDSANPDYSKKNSVDRNWAEVGTLLKCSGSAAKAQWRKLRVYFMDLRRKILATKSGQGLDEVFTPSWQFYTQLMFLVPSVTPRTSVSNLPPVNSTVAEPSSSDIDEDEIEIVEDSQAPDVQASATEPQATTSTAQPDVHQKEEWKTPKSQAQRRKRKPEDEESAKMVELMGSVNEAIKQKANTTTDDYFTSQLLCHLKTIPDSKEKELLKLKIMEEVVSLKYA